MTVKLKTVESKTKKTSKWVYVLKTVDKDMCGYGGFKYPVKGKVVAPDWEPKKECGNGLHALLWAEGGNYLSNDITAKWLVLKVDSNLMVSFSDKVKFKKGFVCYAGNCDGAIAYIKSKMPLSILNSVYGSASATGTKGSASATGTKGSASATGTKGSASATGDFGSASATGTKGSASATGTKGSASATGDFGSASATGTKGSASATGDQGSASATGDFGSASATGTKGSASATGYGTIILSWFDEKAKRYRLVVGYPGENGLKPKTLYTLDENHNFVEVKKEGV
jgi:hypothetical protein